VLDTRAPARVEDFADQTGVVADGARASNVHSVIGVPIVVDGAVWGMIAVGFRQRRGALPVFRGKYTGRLVAATASPREIESRLAAFTELAGTALSRAQAHGELRTLAEEQSALHRVATLVAQGTAPQAVFDAVCAEAGHLLGASSVNLSHYTRDGQNETIAGWSLRDTHVPVGSRYPITSDTVAGQMVETQAPVRVDSWATGTSELATLVRARGIRSSVGAPVVVEGRLWGALVAATDSETPLPSVTEHRLARFTELVATAVSNAAARAELIASRVRIVEAGDEALRRIERDLHDGTQQRLIALGLDLQRIRATVAAEDEPTQSGLARVERELEAVLAEVQELSRGLHPAQLSRGGLGPSLRALARRSAIPVDLSVEISERPPAQIETAVYYVVSEALTNATKYSEALGVAVTVVGDDDLVRASIADDGVGGAERGAGSGLTGLADRVEALGGRFALVSPPERGTTITVELPVHLR
jgi:signal transduction histidine kinase